MNLAKSFFIFMAIICNASAETFYVDSQNGDDNRPPQSAANQKTPWRTISKSAKKLNPGDKLFIQKGRYNESFIEVASGTREKPVELEAEKGAIIEVFRSGKEKQLKAFSLLNAKHIKISGFRVNSHSDETNPIGIYLANSRNITIEKNIIDMPNAYGIYIGKNSSRNIIKDNTIYNTTNGILFHGGNENKICGNDIYKNTRNGVELRDNSSGNILLDNYIAGNRGSGVFCAQNKTYSKSQNIIKNCKITGNAKYGIFLKGANSLISVNNCLISNNKRGSIKAEGGKIEENNISEKENGKVGLIRNRKLKNIPKENTVSVLPSAPKPSPSQYIWKIGKANNNCNDLNVKYRKSKNLDKKTGIYLCDLGEHKESNDIPTQLTSLKDGVFCGQLKIRWIEKKGGARLLKCRLFRRRDIKNTENDFAVVFPDGKKINIEFPCYTHGKTDIGYELAFSANLGENEISILSNHQKFNRGASPYLMFDFLELIDAKELPDFQKIAIFWEKEKGKISADIANLSPNPKEVEVQLKWHDVSGEIFANETKKLLLPEEGKSIKLSIPDKKSPKKKTAFIWMSVCETNTEKELRPSAWIFWDNLGKIHSRASMEDIHFRELLRQLKRILYYNPDKLDASKKKLIEELECKRENLKDELAEFENIFTNCYKKYEDNSFSQASLSKACEIITNTRKGYDILINECKKTFPTECKWSNIDSIDKAPKRPEKITREDASSKILFVGYWYSDPRRAWWNEGFFRKMDILALSGKYATQEISLSPRPGEWDFSLLDEGVSENKAMGFTSDLVAPQHHPRLPYWLYDKYGEENLLNKGHTGIISTGRYYPNIFHPAARKYCHDYYEALAKHFCNNSSVAAYETLNEPTMMAGHHAIKTLARGGYNKEGIEKFREFLKEKFQSIEEINKIYGTDYKGFEEINPPKPDKQEKVAPLEYEFLVFLAESKSEFLSMCYQAIRKYDKTHLIIPQLTCPFNEMIPADAGQIWGFDIVKYQKAINPYVDYFSFHSSQLTSIIYVACMSEYFKKPMSRDEYYWNSPGIGFGEDVSAALTEKNMWLNLAYGCRLFEFFTIMGNDWSQYTSIFDKECGFHMIHRSSAVLSVMRDYIDRYMKLFNSSTLKRNNEIVIIQPSLSTFIEFPSSVSKLDARRLHEILLDNNYSVSYLPEEFILDKSQSLSQYKLAILPYATCFPEGLSNALLDYIKNGGILLASGTPGIYDKRGVSNCKFLQELLGNIKATYLPDASGSEKIFNWIDHANNKTFKMPTSTRAIYSLKADALPKNIKTHMSIANDNSPVLLDGKYGKGSFFISTVPMGNKKFFEDIFAKVIEQSIPVKNISSPQKGLHFVMRKDRNDSSLQYLFAVNRDTMSKESLPREVTIQLKGKFTDIKDLALNSMEISGIYKDGLTSLKTLMNPGQGLAFSMKELQANYKYPSSSNIDIMPSATCGLEKKTRPLITAKPLDSCSSILLPGNIKLKTLYNDNVLSVVLYMPPDLKPEDLKAEVFIDVKNNPALSDGRFEADDFRFSFFGNAKKAKIQSGNRDEDLGKESGFKGIVSELQNLKGQNAWILKLPLNNLEITANPGLKLGFGIILNKGVECISSWPGGILKDRFNTKNWGEIIFLPADKKRSMKFTPDKDGFIRDWLILGPFPNMGLRPDCKGWDYEFVNESSCIPELNEKTEIVQDDIVWNKNQHGAAYLEKTDMLQEKYQRVWKLFSSPDSYVKLLNLFPFKNVAAYAFCEIELEKDEKLLLCAGSDDGVKAWLNHREVLNVHKYRGAKVDEDIVEVRLNKGRNTLLLKVDQDIGGFGFYLRLQSEKNGKAIPFTKYRILL